MGAFLPVILSSFSIQFLIENELSEEDKDSSFSAEVEDDNDNKSQSLGSHDTEVSGSKVQGLHDDTAANMPTPKKVASSKKAKKTSVTEVTAGMSTMTIKSAPHQVSHYSLNLNWSFPFQLYSIVEGSKEIIYADFLCANLPKSYIKMAKVLRGGFQLAFLMAVPKWFYEEFYSRKQMGQEYNKRHARVQAHSRQVIQPVCREFQSLDDFHLGEPQVLNLPFQCIEGDYAPLWGSWSGDGEG